MPILQATEQQIRRLRSLIATPANTQFRRYHHSGYVPTLFLVHAATSYATNKWRYTLREARRNPSTLAMQLVDDGLEVTAYNIAEDGNTDSIAAPGYVLGALPPGWTVYPVSYTRGEGRINRPVVAWFGGYNSSDEPYWHFDAPNVIDGDCPEGSES